MGDGARVRQVLLNLAGNAVKFTVEGEIAVRVSAGREPNGAARLHVSVTDTGIGIPEEGMQHLFQSFTQADSSTTRRFGGTGLGLAIAKSIVELMQGQYRRGERTRPRFPVLVYRGRGTRRRGAGECRPRALQPARVLIVDDNASSRAILERYTAAWGLRPHAAVENGEQALAALRRHHDGGEPIGLVDTRYADAGHGRRRPDPPNRRRPGARRNPSHPPDRDWLPVGFRRRRRPRRQTSQAAGALRVL